MRSTAFYTFIGSLALVMWAIEPLMVSEIEQVPIFQSLFIIFGVSFLVTSIRLTIYKRWHLMRQPLMVWVIGVLGICFPDWAYIYAAKIAPIVHVDLIDYLWPCLVILGISLLPRESLSLEAITGGILGIISIGVMITKGQGISGIEASYIPGYLLALVGAIFWAGYSVISRNMPNTPTETVGLSCGIGSAVCLLLHIKLEQTTPMTSSEIINNVGMGLLGAGVAYQLWDVAAKFGNLRYISVLTYFSQIMGMSLLVLFGKESPSWHLLLSSVLAVSGIFIASKPRFIVPFLAKVVRAVNIKLNKML